MNLNLAELKKRFQPCTALSLTLESERLAVSVLPGGDGGDKARNFSHSLRRR